MNVALSKYRNPDHMTDSNIVIVPDDKPLNIGARLYRKLSADTTVIRSDTDILQDNMVIIGTLIIAHNNIKSLPKQLTVCGSLIMVDCNELEAIPDDLMVGDNIIIQECHKLTTIPALSIDGGSVLVSNCGKLVDFNIYEVGNKLKIDHCPIKSLPSSLYVRYSLTLDTTDIETIPATISAGDKLKLINCPNLTSIECMYVAKQSLTIKHCPNLVQLIDDTYGDVMIFERRSLKLIDCGIKALPKLDLYGGLKLYGCPNLTSLPKGLSVDKLSISNCPNITEFPSDIYIESTLTLYADSGIDMISSRIDVPVIHINDLTYEDLV